MRRICAYIISVVLFSGYTPVHGQDTDAPQDSVTIPLKVSFGMDVSGPVIYFTNKNILNTEAYFLYDLDHKKALHASGGYSNYKYSQYNYSYRNKGIFFKAGVDFNILKPEISGGKYWAGVGLLYGLSRFTWQVDSFSHKNYWGKHIVSMPEQSDWGHYLEVSPGFRAELLKNLSIGWSISLRKLLFTSAPKDLKPAYIPGYGSTGNAISFGMNYFLTFNFSYKKIRVGIKPETPPEPEEEGGSGMGTGIIRGIM